MIKEKLYHKCLAILNSRIEKYKAELELIKESMENDEKNADDDEGNGSGNISGDSYAKTLQYLDEVTKMKDSLKKVNIFQDNEVVKHGSLVECSNGLFFISIPLGKIEMDGQNYFAISTEAPVGKLLQGKKEGESVSFNNNIFKINKIH
ncbi:GreA/GreB family elongation factor [Abyssalbus ytuae]|uniref:GreA/GreB family elongation factor n=1 Tax=Abyssalbus ytuae TaxID=2926907 RepID=A0A9E6ZNK2_9FLAO|nr:GreA/GreB family elongation factor [Abyssalbus ytuae]UOB17625.1 GreA/GreB family elongation factor [Abyssalbus ytuae]